MSPSDKARDFDSRTRRFKSGHPSQKKALAIASAFFSYIRLRRVLLLRSDIRLTPSDIRFASFGGEYNITATVGSNITFAYEFELSQKSRRSRVYHQCGALYITNT